MPLLFSLASFTRSPRLAVRFIPMVLAVLLTSCESERGQLGAPVQSEAPGAGQCVDYTGDPAGCQPSTFDTPIGEMPSVRVNAEGELDPFSSEEAARAGFADLEADLYLFRNFERVHRVVTIPSERDPGTGGWRGGDLDGAGDARGLGIAGQCLYVINIFKIQPNPETDPPVQVGEIPAMVIGNEGFDDRFEREIVRILDAHCVGCHTDREPASSLVTYEETWLNRESILTAILDGHMPPWAAVPGYGSFANDNGLTLRERQFVVSWVEGLGPRDSGEVFLNVRDPSTSDTARPPSAAGATGEFDDWELGEPSLIRTLDPRVVEPGEQGRVETIIVDLGLDSEQRLRGLEFRPGERSVVRSANFYLEVTSQWLGSWTPWYGFALLPSGVAHRLTEESRLVAEIYYGTSDEPVVDGGAIGLLFSDESEGAMATPSDLVLRASREVVPGASRVRLETEAQIGEEIRVISILPQLDTDIQSIELSLRRPDGGTEILLFAKDISLDWPTPYVFERPVVLPRGSVLRAFAYFGNDSDTPTSRSFSLTLSVY